MPESTPRGSAGKESACSAGDLGSVPGFGRIPWRRAWQPAPVFLSSGFAYFFQFKSEFCNKELMIWATVNSQFCFVYCIELLHLRLQRIWSIWFQHWSPYVGSSLVLLEDSVFYDQWVFWQNSVSLCPASFCAAWPNLPLLQVSLDFLLLHSNPYDKNDIIFWC